jgi:hypothetical protein
MTFEASIWAQRLSKKCQTDDDLELRALIALGSNRWRLTRGTNERQEYRRAVMAGDLLVATELVMRDLIEALIQENLFGFADGDREGEWYRVGNLRLRVHDGGALQSLRFAGGPVVEGGRELTPDQLLLIVARDEPRVERATCEQRLIMRKSRLPRSTVCLLGIRLQVNASWLPATGRSIRQHARR